MFLPLFTSAFLEIIKLSSAHISAMYCSSHFFQASVGTSEGGDEFLYGGGYRRASEMAPFSGPEIHLRVSLSSSNITRYNL